MEFVTADLHLDDRFVAKLRGYKNAADMTEELIEVYNSIVGPNDTVYHIGDFAVGERITYLVSRLNGYKALILGNHDERKPFEYVNMGFMAVHTSLLKTVKGKQVILNHDPCIYCAVGGIPILCGHVHTLFRMVENVLNVGYDIWKRPVPIEGLMEYFE
jgi:calcineurin-like phosphoesterase family protein